MSSETDAERRVTIHSAFGDVDQAAPSQRTYELPATHVWPPTELVGVVTVVKYGDGSTLIDVRALTPQAALDRWLAERALLTQSP